MRRLARRAAWSLSRSPRAGGTPFGLGAEATAGALLTGDTGNAEQLYLRRPTVEASCL